MSDPRYNDNISNQVIQNINNGKMSEEQGSSNRNNAI